MKRVVYNGCYGGFGLSVTAIYHLIKMRFPFLEKTRIVDAGYAESDFPMVSDCGTFFAHRYYSVVLHEGYVYSFDGYDAVHRSHPMLVSVVDQMGDSASSNCANLMIYDIEDDDLYRIDEYDGREAVIVLDRADYTDGYKWEPVNLISAQKFIEHK